MNTRYDISTKESKKCYDKNKKNEDTSLDNIF